MTALTLAARCLGPCGLLASGVTTDPPSRPSRVQGWCRWAELEQLAETRTKTTGHATSVAGTTTRKAPTP